MYQYEKWCMKLSSNVTESITLARKTNCFFFLGEKQPNL